MSDPVIITTKHDIPLFDPEDHRTLAAQQICFDPDQIHCIECGPDGFETISEPLYSEDGTLLKERVMSYTRVTAWAPKPKAVPSPEPEAALDRPDPLVHHIPKLSRGARWHGSIDGIEGHYISTGYELVLLDSAEGLRMLSELHSEEVENRTGTGG